MTTPAEKRCPREGLAELGARLRAAGRRVVFTNGCFDLLHVGHLRYLQSARQLGDVLIVGVNADASVRRLKGPARPIVVAEERAELLAGLECVDHVTIFDEDDPIATIRLLRPHVHVKGGDYGGVELPEAAAVREGGGEVVILSLTEGRSTSALLQRLDAANRAG